MRQHMTNEFKIPLFLIRFCRSVDKMAGFLFNMNYRHLYEKETKCKIILNHEVHHIDFNRNNNHISNLVAIDKSLHKNYHTFYNPLKTILYNLKINNWSIDDYISDKWIQSYVLYYYPQKDWAKKLIKTTKKINKYIQKRNKLLNTNYNEIVFNDDELKILNYIQYGRIY